MRQSLRLGRVAGIPVGAHWSALAIVLLVAVTLAGGALPVTSPGYGSAVYWIVGTVTGLLLMASLLAHELAHALAARHYRIEVASVTLWALGGITEFREDTPSPRAELATAAAGPAASLVVGAVAFGVAVVLPHSGPVTTAAAWLAVMNLMLAVFNLLPGSPLDGGRILHALLWRRHGDRSRADAAVARAGYAIGVLLAFVGLTAMWTWSLLGGLWLMITGWYILGAARGEALGRTARKGLGGMLVKDVMTADPDLAPGWLSVEDLVVNVVLRSHQSVFPVVSFAGEPMGAVSLENLIAVPVDRRRAIKVEALVAGQRPPRVLSPYDDAAVLLDGGPGGGGLPGVVVEGHHVVGMVTTADLGRMWQQALLKPVASA